MLKTSVSREVIVASQFVRDPFVYLDTRSGRRVIDKRWDVEERAEICDKRRTGWSAG